MHQDALDHYFLKLLWFIELRPMTRVLKPDELLATRRFQNAEVMLGDFTCCDAITSPFEEVNWNIEMRRLLE